MENINTLTIIELIEILKQFPFDTKIYLSSDSEGNSYGTLNKEWSFSYTEEEKVLCLMQFNDHLSTEDVVPKLMAQIKKELEEEEKNNA